MTQTKPPAEFDWSALAKPVVMPDKLSVGSITVDVIATVPAPIRERAEASLAINHKQVAAKAASTASRKRIAYHWDCQQVASTEMGDKFVALITKYAKYRPANKDIPHAAEGVAKGQVTARCGKPQHYRDAGEDGIVACDAKAAGAFVGVRYSVRPFEKRKDTATLPGAATS